MSFKDFINKYNLKYKATSNIKIYQLLSSLSFIDVGIYLREEPFKTDIGIVNLRPETGTHCTAYIDENYFDSYGCALPEKICKFIM